VMQNRVIIKNRYSVNRYWHGDKHQDTSSIWDWFNASGRTSDHASEKDNSGEKMISPYFSVVIPTFNRSDLFPYTVQSILNQTFEDFEIVLSDNCSSDNTPEIAQQFKDPRFKYVRTPRHFTIADSCEFVRMKASGRSIIMLSDDDVLMKRALERYAAETEDCDTDFLFSSIAEYRDASYPGPDKNSVTCPGFSGSSRVLSADEFVRPLFKLKPKFFMHPSACIFPKKIADYVERRTGRFFWTNGFEYSAFPICAVLAKRIVKIDLPLAILGRTAKTWGTNMGLCNPGKEKIQELINDVDHIRRFAPLHNFTMINLMTEGMLTAKHLFPNEFATYEFDERRYLRSTMRELRKREALGVDVSAEINETLQYSSKYPDMESDLRNTNGREESKKASLVHLIRSGIEKSLGRKVRERIHAFQLRQQLERGMAGQRFRASGDAFGFSNILECSKFFDKWVVTPESNRPSPSWSAQGGSMAGS
jgi:glycosyltransferase involved in cell wall biosynthesis